MTIFLTQQMPNADLSDLKRFGHVVRSVTTRGIYPDEGQERLDAVVAWAVQVLSDFHPTTDLIALGGDPVVLAAVVQVASDYSRSKGFNYIRLLKWDRHEASYYEVCFNLPQIGRPNGKECAEEIPHQG